MADTAQQRDGGECVNSIEPHSQLHAGCKYCSEQFAMLLESYGEILKLKGLKRVQLGERLERSLQAKPVA